MTPLMNSTTIIIGIIVIAVLWACGFYSEQKRKSLKRQVDAEIARIQGENIPIRQVSEQEFMEARQRFINTGQLDERALETLAMNELQGELQARQQSLEDAKAVFHTIGFMNWMNKSLAEQGHQPIPIGPELEAAGKRHATELGKQLIIR